MTDIEPAASATAPDTAPPGSIPGGRGFLFRRHAAASGLLLRGKRTATVLRQANVPVGTEED